MGEDKDDDDEKREGERDDLRTGTISSLCALCLCYLKPDLAFSIQRIQHRHSLLTAKTMQSRKYQSRKRNTFFFENFGLFLIWQQVNIFTLLYRTRTEKKKKKNLA